MDPTLAVCSAGCRCFPSPVSHSRRIGPTGVCWDGTQKHYISLEQLPYDTEKCIYMILSPGARLKNLPVSNRRGQAGAGRALGDGLGTGGRVKASSLMERRLNLRLGAAAV